MTIFTPRGLKIRVDVQQAFTQMARLYPEVKPFKFLKTVEGIEVLPGMLCFPVGLLVMLLKFNPIDIAIWSFGAQLLGFLLIFWPIIPFGLPFIVVLGTLYSYITGYGILLILLAVIGFFLVGWQGVLAYFVGKFAAIIIQYIIEFANMKFASMKNTLKGEVLGEVPPTSSERNYLIAYLMYARKFNKEIDMTVSDSEVESGKGKELLNEFANEWPQVVSRFE